jgi:hypothetical protein
MWNLLALGNSSSLYRPTAYTDVSSKAIGEEYAYDADSYPWATSATLTADSSGTANTPDNFDLIYTTFGTLSKANFSSALVQIALLEVAVTGSPGAYDNHASTAGLTVSYSTDGGSTFTDAAYYICDAFDSATGTTYHSATAQTIYTSSATVRCISPYWASSDIAFTLAPWQEWMA